MKKILLPATIIMACLFGCDSSQNSNSEKTGMPGSDKDEHGCIASAGYQWCEQTKQCQRPWELAEKEGFENTAEQFEAYCYGQ